ncbi:hypothetical protein [Burkholderia sp. ABCPW 14]|uniref:hypothetical protein n=1 Tax=Burkholderia sp. ABCPW 14 TaxID=1637860 RepID=UPI0018D2158F|nr:hypothetical protein [Burkholderia sp. ABCPW 14]
MSADFDGSRIATDRRRAPAASHDACAARDIGRVSRRRPRTTSRNERQPRRERTRKSDIALLFSRRESQLLETRPSGGRTLAIPSSVVALAGVGRAHRADGTEPNFLRTLIQRRTGNLYSRMQIGEVGAECDFSAYRDGIRVQGGGRRLRCGMSSQDSRDRAKSGSSAMREGSMPVMADDWIGVPGALGMPSLSALTLLNCRDWALRPAGERSRARWNGFHAATHRARFVPRMSHWQPRYFPKAPRLSIPVPSARSRGKAHTAPRGMAAADGACRFRVAGRRRRRSAPASRSAQSPCWRGRLRFAGPANEQPRADSVHRPSAQIDRQRPVARHLTFD